MIPGKKFTEYKFGKAVLHPPPPPSNPPISSPPILRNTGQWMNFNFLFGLVVEMSEGE